MFERNSIEEWRCSALKPIYPAFCPVRYHAPSYTWKLDKKRRGEIKEKLAKSGLDLTEKKQLGEFAEYMSTLIPTPLYRKPYMSSIIDVHLQNEIKPQEVFDSLSEPGRYYVYAHTFDKNTYIGRTNDLVNRWFEHFDAAFNPFHSDHNYIFKSLIRQHYRKFKHHLLFVTNYKAEAIEYESQAIEFYKPNLNDKNEIALQDKSFHFTDIDVSAPTIPMSRLRRNWSTAGEKSPVMAVAKYDTRRGRVRIYCDSGQQYPEGTLITCSKPQRANLHHGQRVIINVRWQAAGKCLNGLSEDLIAV